MYYCNLFICHANILRENHIVEELHLIIMKVTYLKIGIKEMLSELIKDLLNGINMIYFVSIDQDVFWINNYKNV